jgi:subtilisin family serine protease
MEKRKIIIELYHNNSLESTSLALSQGEEAKFDLSAAGIEKSPGISIDKDYGVVQLPKLSRVDPFDMNVSDEEKKNYYVGDMSVDLAPTNSTYLVRAEVDAKKLEKVCTELKANSQVAAVFSDVAIEPCIICPGSPAVGSHTDVERLLCVSKMKAKGMTGRGVFVAIVDTGVNMNYLNSKGKTPSINLAWSWKPTTSTITLGSAPVGHGTMCAFDVCIAAPQSTLLDIALLSSRAGGGFSGFLSDAIKAYEHLIRFMNRNIRPGENKSLVVNNSWGMFHPSWDFPVGDPRNYSSNPLHPFNRIVGTLAAMGADILFAAGNCGSECPDGRCQNVTNQGIYGANSHPAVTTVVGIGVNSERVGYSNRGPGRLANRKPDITAFTHFAGSGVYTADGGTSAATPVLAGVVWSGPVETDT